jgi:hypothetical protein
MGEFLDRVSYALGGKGIPQPEDVYVLYYAEDGKERKHFLFDAYKADGLLGDRIRETVFKHHPAATDYNFLPVNDEEYRAFQNTYREGHAAALSRYVRDYVAVAEVAIDQHYKVTD